MNPQVVSVPQLPVPSVRTLTLRQRPEETLGILRCDLQDLWPRFLQDPPDARRHQVDGVWCVVWPPHDFCSGGQQWTERRVCFQQEPLRRNAGQSLFLLLVEPCHYPAHTKMTVRKRVQPELHILRVADEVVELDFLLSCKVRLQDTTEIIPSTPLGDACCSPDSVPSRVFCRETLSSAQAAAPGTVSAPASLPLVPCSPPHQRPPYLEARATFSVSPLPRLP